METLQDALITKPGLTPPLCRELPTYVFRKKKYNLQNSRMGKELPRSTIQVSQDVAVGNDAYSSPWWSQLQSMGKEKESQTLCRLLTKTKCLSFMTDRNKTNPHSSILHWAAVLWDHHKTCTHLLDMSQSEELYPGSLGTCCGGTACARAAGAWALQGKGKAWCCQALLRTITKDTKRWADAGAHLGRERI